MAPQGVTTLPCVRPRSHAEVMEPVIDGLPPGSWPVVPDAGLPVTGAAGVWVLRRRQRWAR